jgi:hypothetical protein
MNRLLSGVLIIALFVLILATQGCAVGSVTEFVPSLKYCDALDYSRRGKQFAVQASCELP